jgi:hypothetical protein
MQLEMHGLRLEYLERHLRYCTVVSNRLSSVHPGTRQVRVMDASSFFGRLARLARLAARQRKPFHRELLR